jgi:hypothetical protein
MILREGQMNFSIDELKKKYVEYFTDVPIQKYAAMAIGRDEDTIILWKAWGLNFQLEITLL